MSEPSDSLREQFGDIDVYLFDQQLRGRMVSGLEVLDAGCVSRHARPSNSDMTNIRPHWCIGALRPNAQAKLQASPIGMIAKPGQAAITATRRGM